MAGKTITQRIKLEGGEEIKVTFEDLGAAGAAAFKKIREAAESVDTVDRWKSAIDQLKVSYQQLGDAAKKIGAQFGTLQQEIAKAARNVTLVSAAIAGAIGGFALLVIRAATAADEIQKTADALGLTVQQLQNLSFAAVQAGVSTDKFTGFMGRLNRAMGAAQTQALQTQKRQSDVTRQFARGKITMAQYSDQIRDINLESREQINAFTRLGIATHNADGSLRNTRDVTLDIADAFERLPNGAEKAALATELFGRGGQQMTGFLNQGSDAIIRMEGEAQRLAPALSKLEQQVGERLNGAFDSLKAAATSASRSLLLVFAPSITQLVGALTEFIAANRATFITWAGTLAARVRPVIQDIVALLEGRDQDVKNTFIVKMRDAFVGFVRDFKAAVTDILIPAIGTLVSALDVVAQAMNGLFGTNVTGQQIAIALAITNIIGLFGVLTTAVGIAATAVGALVGAFGGVGAVLILVGLALNAFIIKSLGGLQGIQDKWNGTWAAVGEIVTGALDSVTGLISDFGDGVDAVFGGIVSAAQTVWNAIVGGFQSAINTITGFFDSLLTGALAIFAKIIDAARSVASAIASAAGGGGGTSSDSTPGFASGGHVRGPGTGTSDSILARVSNGEYVNREAAVDKYGVPFFDAINGLRVPLQNARAAMRGINMSGIGAALSASLMPRTGYASGGLVSAGAGSGGLVPANIHINGGRAVPVFAAPNTLSQLRREATASQLRSMGRKPSWYRG
jgi:phage-related protein